MGREGLEDSFEDHEETAPVFAAVDLDVGEVELQGLGGALDIRAEPLGEDRLACSDVTGYEDLGTGGPGLVDDRPEELGEEA